MLRLKQSTTSCIVIITFLTNLFIGNGLLLPTLTLAFHDPNTGDQGHTPGDPNPPEACNSPEEPCQGKHLVASEVYLQAGDYSSTYTDFLIPGRGPRFAIVRSFDSQERYDGPFGTGWKFNYDVRLLLTHDGEKEIAILRMGDGLRLKFVRNENGSYTRVDGREDYLSMNLDGTYTWKPSGCANCGSAATGHHFDGSGALIKQVDTNGNEMGFDYDSTGRLIQVTDASGRSLTIAYGPNNKISTISDPVNRVFTYAYDSDNNLITYTDPAGNTTTYSYDANHNLMGVTDSEGNTTHSMVFDDQNRLTSYTKYGQTWTVSYDERFGVNKTYVKDADDNTYTYQYNDTGQLLYQWDPLGNQITNTWDEDLNLISVRDARGFTTSYTYNENGEKISETDALGNTTNYTYDTVENQLATITDPAGVVTKYEYDDNGNLAKYIRDYGSSLQSQISYTYDSNGFLTETIHPMGNKISYSYDTYGNRILTTDSLGNVTTYTYDMIGNMLTLTDPAGNTTTFSYDSLNRIETITDAAGNVTSLAYDASANVSGINLADGSSMTMSHDAYGNLTQITDFLGNSINYSYDNWGNRISAQDANDNTTSYTYDVIGRLTQESNALGISVQYAYDRNGNRITTTDANGNITAFAYDALNRLTKTTYPGGNYEIFSYGANGNLISRRDRKGDTITYTYDALQRLTTKTYPDDSTVTYAYNLNGRVISAENDAVSYSATYDSMDRLTAMTNTTLGKSLSYAYTEHSLRSSMTNPEGGSTTYVYDILNRLTSITNGYGEKTEYTFDLLSRIIRKSVANGSYSTFAYDSKGQLTNQANKTSSDTVISTYAYSYDSAGNKTTLDDTIGTHSYTYDKIYQLLNATHPATATETYTYDGVYNRLTSTSHDDWTYDENNRLLSYANMSFNYDANGNMTTETDTVLAETMTFQYSYENRLKRIDFHDGSFVEFSYDPFGNRVKKDSDGTVTWFVYDLNSALPDVIAEYNSTGELIVNYTHDPRTDSVVSMHRDGKSYYYLNDGLGSVTGLVDENETLVNSYTYDAFGNVLSETAAVLNPYGFTGRRLDKESGLMYYRARYYHPTIGRFISTDPIGFAGGINAYSYVLNNPINAIDPEGLKDCQEEYADNFWGWAKFIVAWAGWFGSLAALLSAAGPIAIGGGIGLVVASIAVMATSYDSLKSLSKYWKCLASLKKPCPGVSKEMAKLKHRKKVLTRARKASKAVLDRDMEALKKEVRFLRQEYERTKPLPGPAGLGGGPVRSPSPGVPNPGEPGNYASPTTSM
jgi:RHS repeat-associated protein